MTKLKLIIFILCLLFSVSSVYAENEFLTDFNIEYTITPQANTIVTNAISLTNKITNIYPKEYSIVYDTDKISNIIASDNIGIIKPEVFQENGNTKIKLIFNDKVIGIGKKMDFVLKFENADIARKVGSIWEINIPGIEKKANINTYNVKLITPPLFGPPAYLYPKPIEGRRWNKDQLFSGGITGAYGSEQRYSVKLIYFLENNENRSNNYEIAIPPDTYFQKSSIYSLDPKPVNIKQDEDGNWLANYVLSPNQRIQVNAEVIISVFASPRTDYKTDILNKQNYLKETYYWNSNDVQIRQLASKYNTPEKIYEYIISTLKYRYPGDQEQPQRQGAIRALQNPDSAVCMEFTDLFVAIARAAGIPARQVIGYAYTTNSKLRPLSLVSDVLHAWPEYFDEKLNYWKPVDPTWTFTTGGINYFDKMDFNHVVFVINGIRDDYPLPAGAYNNSENKQKLVEVKFIDSSSYNHIVGSIQPVIYFPKQILSAFAVGGTLEIQNNSGASLNNIQVKIESSSKIVNLSQQINSLPPLNVVKVPFTYKRIVWLMPVREKISVTINNQKAEHEFNILPVIPFIILIIIIIFIICLCIIIILKSLQKMKK